MSVKRIFYGVVFGLLCLFQIGLLRAETIPATSVPGGTVAPSGFIANSKTGATKEAACKANAAHWVADNAVNGPGKAGACWSYYVGYVQETWVYANACPAGSTMANYVCTSAATYTCPSGQGWTVNGSNCQRDDCQSGYDRNSNGQCQKNCTNKNGMATPSAVNKWPNGAFPMVIGGCTVDCATISGGGSSRLIPDETVGTNCKFTGASPAPDEGTPAEGTGFTPKPKAPDTKTDCTGAGMGFIQSSTGAVTCVPNSSAPAGQKAEVKTKTGTESGTPSVSGGVDPAAPDYVKVEKETTTEGDETKTTEKKSTNPDTAKNGTVNGGCDSASVLTDGKCIVSTVKKESTTDFCTSNPNAAQCKEFKDACKEDPDRASCKDLGEPVTENGVTEESFGVTSISTVAFASNASCPSDISLPKGASLSFAWPCNLATSLRPIILALAWLAAGLIVVGSFRNS